MESVPNITKNTNKVKSNKININNTIQNMFEDKKSSSHTSITKEQKLNAFNKLNKVLLKLNKLSVDGEKSKINENISMLKIKPNKNEIRKQYITENSALEIENNKSHNNEIDNDFDAFDDAYESSDDSDDDYQGYCYCIDSDEELDEEIHKTYDRNALQLLASTEPSIKKKEHNLDEFKYYTPNSPFAPSLFPNVPPYWSFSSHNESGPEILPELKEVLKWRSSPFIPKIVRKVVDNSGYRMIKRCRRWVVAWERNFRSECFQSLKSYQKFNHLPCTFIIGRKDNLWKCIKLSSRLHGKREFGFMQKTYILPQELSILKKEWAKFARKQTKWIVKPPASSRGNGIRVINNWNEFPKNESLILQKYIEKPLIINGSKFDLRLYVIVMSINPLRVYMHRDGLARFASAKYKTDTDSLKDPFIHLTNYSINKLSENYLVNEDINSCQGHKWSLTSLMTYLKERKINTKRLWGTLRNLVIKTIISSESSLNRLFKSSINYRYNSFELFGFDVLLDENLTPWLLEINISPSFHSDLPIDTHIKGPLIQSILNTALFQVPPTLKPNDEEKIKSFYNINGRLCYDKRIFTTELTATEIKKHNFFTNSDIDHRDEYLDGILEFLTPDDVRCLIIAEDELAKSSPLERIFPTSTSYQYMKFFQGPRYYNRLLDAWEYKYHKDRSEGIQLLRELCKENYHLETAPLDEESIEVIDIFELNLILKNLAKGLDTNGDPIIDI